MPVDRIVPSFASRVSAGTVSARRTLVIAVLAAGLGSGGCYTGIDPAPPDADDPFADDGETDGEPADDDAGPGRDDDPAPADDDPDCEQRSPDFLRRLTASQYQHTVEAITGLVVPPALAGLLAPVQAPESGFANDASVLVVRQSDADAYQRIAEAVTRARFAAPAEAVAWLGCDPADPPCLTDFVDHLGRLAFRRPLTATETERLHAVAEDAPGEPALGVLRPFATVLEALLQSPQFIWVIEPSDDAAEVLPLDDYQLATRIALALWDQGPDDALLDLARDGVLSDPQRREEIIATLVADPRTDAGLLRYATEAFEVDALRGAPFGSAPSAGTASVWRRDAELELVAALQRHVVHGDLRDLYIARTARLTAALAQLYGVQLDALGTSGDDAAVDVEFDPDARRGGLFGTAAFLATHASPQEASPVQRGAAVRRIALCTEPPPPPPEVEMGDGTDADHGTQPACWGCHEMLDPIGWGLDRYGRAGELLDAHGDGTPIRDDGYLNDVPGSSFGDAPSLGQAVIDSPTFTRCAVKKTLSWTLAKPPGPAEQCLLEGLIEPFADGGFATRDLVGGILASPLLTARAMPQMEMSDDE